MGLSVAIRHGPGGRLGHFGAGRLSLGRVAAGRRQWVGRAYGFRSRPAALDPERAAPHLSAQHMCVEASVHEARAGPLWQRKSPLHWQVGGLPRDYVRL